MGTRRQDFGAYLAHLRQASRRSQRQLAERLCALSGVPSLTRNEVSRWERGERIPDSWLPFLARALDVPLGVLERAAARARGESDAATHQDVGTADAGWVAAPGLPPEDPHIDRAAMDSFRMADRQLGGGHLYTAVTHYLAATMGPKIFGSQVASRTHETFRAAAALTEMAGWMAHDSGRDDRAQRHFEHALPLARAGSDSALTAHILASMSHLALQRGQPGQAARLARAGQSEAATGVFVPTLIARLHAMEARALARAGEGADAGRAIEAAEESLGRNAEEPPSVWISHFDEASLASEATLCLRDLGRHRTAAEQAERAVRLRSGDRARSRVFGQISQAVIHAELGELEVACEVGDQLLDSCRVLGSLRITRQLDELAVTLRPFASERRVARLLDALGEVQRQRRLLLAGISFDPEGLSS